MQGQLFTSDFLAEGIKETQVWKQLDDASVDAFVGKLASIYAPVKADTENDLIVKVLAELGWPDLLRQHSATEKRREDIPDLLLFPDAKAKDAALKEKREDRRYRHGLAILESKRWLRARDRGDATDRLHRLFQQLATAIRCRLLWRTVNLRSMRSLRRCYSPI